MTGMSLYVGMQPSVQYMETMFLRTFEHVLRPMSTNQAGCSVYTHAELSYKTAR
jgi:hypothetical protein